MKYQPPLQNCIAFRRQHHSFLSNTNVSNITHYSHASSSSVVTCHRRYMSFTVFWWQTWQAWVGQFQIERYRLYCSFQTEQPYSSDGLIRDLLVCSFTTVVKELRSKMFGQHPGYFKAVFLKQTRIIIVSIYKYTVYIMFWIMMLHDCYYY